MDILRMIEAKLDNININIDNAYTGIDKLYRIFKRKKCK